MVIRILEFRCCCIFFIRMFVYPVVEKRSCMGLEIGYLRYLFEWHTALKTTTTTKYMTCYPLKNSEIFISIFGLEIHGNLDHWLIKVQHFLHIILNLHWNGFITEVLKLATLINIGARCKDSSMSKPHGEVGSLPYSKNTPAQRTQVNLHAITF